MQSPVSEAAVERPLAGTRVLVTRAREQASSLVRLLQERGATAIEFPTIRFLPPSSFAPLDAAIAMIATYQWAVFTSVNGVHRFAARLAESGLSPKVLERIRIVAIGPATAAALRDLGVDVEIVPSSSVGEALVAELRAYDLRGARVLLPQAEAARDVVSIGLSDGGAHVDAVATYRSVDAGHGDYGRTLLASGGVDAVTLTSSSTARNLVSVLGAPARTLLGSTTIASIGPITSQTARDLGLTVTVEATDHTLPGLVNALEGYVGGQSNGK